MFYNLLTNKIYFINTQDIIEGDIIQIDYTY